MNKIVLVAFALVALTAARSTPEVNPVWDRECGSSQYPDAGEEFRAGRMIVGGQDARPGEFPWQVSLRRASSGSHFCGGVIINPKWILTAAHCVENSAASSLSVVVGEHDRSASSNANRRAYSVAMVFVNEEYGGVASFDADIALLALGEKIVYNDAVRPACPPVDNLYVGETSTVSGWGTESSGASTLPSILKWVNVPITTNEDCQTAIPRYTITPGMICAGRIPENERDSCQGDSGGPLVIKNSSGRFELVGLVSWGLGCASGTPGVYARVEPYLGWIDSKVNGFKHLI